MNYTLAHPEFGGVETAHLTQGLVNKFFAKHREKNVAPEAVSVSEYASVTVTAAVEAGWFPGVMAGDIENMDPRRVFWMAVWVNGYLSSIVQIDPLPSGPWSNMPGMTSGPVQSK